MTILDCDKNSISKILWTHIAEADSREVLLLQHLARIPYPVRPSLGSESWRLVEHSGKYINFKSHSKSGAKKDVFFVKRFLVTQWKSCDLWLLCLEALIIELSFWSIQKMSLGLFIHFQEIGPVTNQKPHGAWESNFEKSESSPCLLKVKFPY